MGPVGSDAIHARRLAKDLEELARSLSEIPHLQGFGSTQSDQTTTVHLVYRVTDANEPSNGGEYFFNLVLDRGRPNYWPFSLPSVYCLTPNGRFETNGKSICISGITHHHGDQASSATKLTAIATGIMSIFLDFHDTPDLGGIRKPIEDLKRDVSVLAKSSEEFNQKNDHHTQIQVWKKDEESARMSRAKRGREDTDVVSDDFAKRVR